MPDDYQQLWIQRNLNTLAATRAAEAIESTGRALPCQVTAVNGSIVTVKFEVTVPYVMPDGTASTYTLPPLTLPKAESQWMRAPTQVGDFGMTVPADTFLGGISGLGAGVADLGVDYGNLTTLVFVPVAAAGFSAAPDPNKAWVNGPAGAVISDTAQTAAVTVAKNLVTIQGGSGPVQLQGGSGAADGIMNATLTHNALVAFKTAMVTAGITGASSIVVPTVTGSSESFTA